MVEIKLPPPTRNVSPKTIALAPNTKLIRIFDPTRYNATAREFRSFGPISRFDHHRSGKHKQDLKRRIIYVGLTLSCCLVEYFGDGDKIDVKNKQVARIFLSKSLTLLDLRGSGAMAAGTVSAISGTAQKKISQAWGRYFYENPQLYGLVNGLIFSGAHNAEDVIALYERAESVIDSSRLKIMSLNHPTLKSSILKIAKGHGLIVEPYV
ncbi:MAG: RES family NAD+ phosphorylase [Waterburya sp.]